MATLPAWDRHRRLLQHSLVPTREVLSALPRYHPRGWGQLGRSRKPLPVPRGGPVTFERSIRVTIEHGHANKRSDDDSSVPTGTRPNRTDPSPYSPSNSACPVSTDLYVP